MAEAPEEECEQLRKLFVGNLDLRTSEVNLKAHFVQWGEITKCTVIRDMITKRSRGFGFITYKKISMVNEAISHNPHVIDGSLVEAKRAVPREDTGKPEAHATVKKIFISGLADNDSENDLHRHFSQYGNIVSVNIIINRHTGQRRGFAFIEFDNCDSVDKVVLRQHKIHGRSIEVKKALPKTAMSLIRQELPASGQPRCLQPTYHTGAPTRCNQGSTNDQQVYGNFPYYPGVQACHHPQCNLLIARNDVPVYRNIAYYPAPIQTVFLGGNEAFNGGPTRPVRCVGLTSRSLGPYGGDEN